MNIIATPKSKFQKAVKKSAVSPLKLFVSKFSQRTSSLFETPPKSGHFVTNVSFALFCPCCHYIPLSACLQIFLPKCRTTINQSEFKNATNEQTSASASAKAEVQAKKNKFGLR